VSVLADCAVWLAAVHAVITLPARCTAVSGPRPRTSVCTRFHEPSQPDALFSYASGQAAMLIPLLPGGIGLVESAMTAALTARHVRAVPALSAVLLYRVIDYWIVLLVGVGCWLILRRR
jgi:uncharacterized membrane protein YbhN (UPF0104 family)